MTTTILRWGHGLGLRIPLALARKAGLERGSAVEVLLHAGRICIEPVPREVTLEHLLAGMPLKLLFGSRRDSDGCTAEARPAGA